MSSDKAHSGNLFIVAAPSGAGKTTLVRELLGADPALQLSISYTTRAPRPGEENGREYHFVTVDDFLAKRDRGGFLEWAEVHGNYYGTSREWLAAEQAAGRDVVLEIDWQGAAQVRSHFPAAVSVFIMPPSLAELERRLTGRGQDTPEVIRRRLDAALGEMRHVGEFDYVIINDVLSEALSALRTIVEAARLRTPVQQARHPALFAFTDAPA